MEAKSMLSSLFSEEELNRLVQEIRRAIESTVAGIPDRLERILATYQKAPLRPTPTFKVVCDYNNNSPRDLERGLLRIALEIDTSAYTPPTGWVALKHKSNRPKEWSIAPRAYFEKHGRIPDGHSRLVLNGYGLDEVADHTLLITVKDISDERQFLRDRGFEILENPVWYYERPGYVPKDW